MGKSYDDEGGDELGDLMRENAEQVLEALSMNEVKIARLYLGFANAFPEMNGFWNGLAKEEFVHSELLRKMGINALSLPNVEIGNKLLATIEKFQALIDSEEKKLKDKGFDNLDALAIAVNIERSFLENRFFAFINPEHPIYEVTVGRIISSTRQHEARVRSRFETEKNRISIGLTSKKMEGS